MDHIEYKVKVYSNGDKHWWLNDQRHREDGPAIEYANGDKTWWLKGERLSEEDFNLIQHYQQMNSVSCTGKIVEIDGKKYKLSEV